MSHFRLRIVRMILMIAALIAAGASAHGEVSVPPFISDHMVLQRTCKAPIWGTASPGERITVRFRQQERQATADAVGKWRVELLGLSVGDSDVLTISGSNTITLRDVVVGDVWIGSGQSNMEGTVGGYKRRDGKLAKWASVEHPEIRGCTAHGAWMVATPETNNAFSALLFSFAIRLQEDLQVPIGIMVAAVGGTPSGAWVTEAAVATDEAVQKQIASYAKVYKRSNPLAAPQDSPSAKAVARSGRAGKPLMLPGTVNGEHPGYLFEKHIRPFVGYGIRGVLWDQGEAGTRMGGVDQDTLMGTLIRGWRQEWAQGDFPFIYVQKPSGGGCAWDPADPVTAHSDPFTPLDAELPAVSRDGAVVETYVRMLRYPNVGMAISSDLGSGVHPLCKSGYGSRAARVALGMVYGKPIEYYGPLYASHIAEEGKIRISFTHLGAGLAWRHDQKLQGFIVAGADQRFHWADAEIEGETVLVSSPHVAQPVAVRYGWGTKRPWANLFNKDGLPAVPFRSDSW